MQNLYFSLKSIFGKQTKKIHFFEEAKSEGVPVYGLTRNVGQFKDETIDPDRNYDFELIAMHSTILGDDCETYPLKVKLKIKTHLNPYQKFSIEKKLVKFNFTKIFDLLRFAKELGLFC